MDILMKYAKKKTVFILSTVLSGIVTLLYLISKFGPTTSSNVNINDINELAGTIGSMVTIIQIIFYLFIILAIVTAILSGVYFFKKNKQEYVMLGEFIVSCITQYYYYYQCPESMLFVRFLELQLVVIIHHL